MLGFIFFDCSSFVRLIKKDIKVTEGQGTNYGHTEGRSDRRRTNVQDKKVRYIMTGKEGIEGQ